MWKVENIHTQVHTQTWQTHKCLSGGQVSWDDIILWSQIHEPATSGRWNSPRVCLSLLPGLVICPHLWSTCETVMRYVCIWWLGVGSAVTASAPARRRRGRGRGRTRKARDTSEILPQPVPNKVTCGKTMLPLSLSSSPSLSIPSFF